MMDVREHSFQTRRGREESTHIKFKVGPQNPQMKVWAQLRLNSDQVNRRTGR